MKKREKKQEEAKERVRLAGEYSPQEQLRRLDERLGVGIGAKKEHARLLLKAAAGSWIKKMEIILIVGK